MQLIDAPNPIQKTDFGAIVIRCEDYLGPARGTLTTIADTKSVAGTVVKDTQQLAVATSTTSLTTRWGLASDTLRVPWADINALYDISAGGVYVLLGLKVLGTAPSTAQIGSSFYGFTNNAYGPTLAFGRDSTFFNSVPVPKSVWGDQYRFSNPFTFSEASMSGTDLTVRAWGLTGGNIELYLDVIYLIPFGGLWTSVQFPNNFQPLQLFSNGVVANDQDNNSAHNSLTGKFSVFLHGSKFTWPFVSGAPADFQYANDEVLAYDMHTNLWDGVSASPPLLDPPSRLIIPACHMYLPAQTIMSESFNTPQAGSAITKGADGYSIFTALGNWTGGPSGWYVPSPGGYAELVSLANQSGLNFTPHAELSFGGYGAVAGSAPNQGNAVLSDMEDCVQLISFSIQQSGIIYFLFGLCDQPSPGVPDWAPTVGARIHTNGSGGLILTLSTNDTNVSPGSSFGYYKFNQTFSSPYTVTSGYSLGSTYWLKVERRRYFWRAKCWADGDAEPGWQVTGFQSFAFRNSAGTVTGWIDYPWDDNWPGNLNHDNPIVSLGPFKNWGTPGLVAYPGENQGANQIRIYSYELSIDPGSSTPGDMHVAEQKYDYSTQWDQITVPFGSWRLIETNKRTRRFNADSHGWNLRTWKDASSPALQSSCIPVVWELVYDSKPLSWYTFAPLK